MKKSNIIILTILTILIIIPIFAYYFNPSQSTTSNLQGRIFGGETFKIRTVSMEPTLLVGDEVEINTSSYNSKMPNINDIVLFSDARNTKVKKILRVIAREGEVVKIDSGYVYVDNKKMDQSYLDKDKAIKQISMAMNEYTVPKGKIFLLGDNRDSSNDSRFAPGPVPIGNIIGKAIKIKSSKNKNGIGEEIK
jgi:signal peptidase I